MIYIGVDPGVSGAIAVFSAYKTVFPIPIEGDTVSVLSIINEIPFGAIEERPIAYIEKVWRPAKLVRIAGVVEGILLSMAMNVYRVAPSTWRKEILGNKNATKEDAIMYCNENFSDINLLRTEKSRVPDHNLAEAICIAEYARRKHSVPDNNR